MDAHTDGPWEWVGCSIETRDGYVLEVEYPAVFVIGDADKRLIAAAPDLLEALKRCNIDHFGMSLRDTAFCRAAIARATGATV